MSTDTSPNKAKWPTVICVICLIYVFLYGLLYVRPPKPEASLFPIIQSIGICLLLFVGAIGVGLRRKWAAWFLVASSVLIVARVAFSFISIIVAMSGIPPIITLISILVFMLPTLAWPVFIIYWFSRSSTKSIIQEQRI
jgi:hypothetical protein